MLSQVITQRTEHLTAFPINSRAKSSIAQGLFDVDRRLAHPEHAVVGEKDVEGVFLRIDGKLKLHTGLCLVLGVAGINASGRYERVIKQGLFKDGPLRL